MKSALTLTSYNVDAHKLKPFVYAGKIMDAMREAWTDGRLDDLNGRVGELSGRMHAGFEGVNARIDRLGFATDSKIEALRTEVRTEFRALNRLILGFGGALITAVIADTIIGRL
jgi:hypothetical protein